MLLRFYVIGQQNIMHNCEEDGRPYGFHFVFVKNKILKVWHAYYSAFLSKYQLYNCSCSKFPLLLKFNSIKIILFFIAK